MWFSFFPKTKKLLGWPGWRSVGAEAVPVSHGDACFPAVCRHLYASSTAPRRARPRVEPGRGRRPWAPPFRGEQRRGRLYASSHPCFRWPAVGRPPLRLNGHVSARSRAESDDHGHYSPWKSSTGASVTSAPHTIHVASDLFARSLIVDAVSITPWTPARGHPHRLLLHCSFCRGGV